MKRLILSLVVVAAPVHAFDWPWQDTPAKATVTAGVSRIQDWPRFRIMVQREFSCGWTGTARPVPSSAGVNSTRPSTKPVKHASASC